MPPPHLVAQHKARTSRRPAPFLQVLYVSVPTKLPWASRVDPSANAEPEGGCTTVAFVFAAEDEDVSEVKVTLDVF